MADPLTQFYFEDSGQLVTVCPNRHCDEGRVFDAKNIYDPGKPCPTCEGRGTIPRLKENVS